MIWLKILLIAIIIFGTATIIKHINDSIYTIKKIKKERPELEEKLNIAISKKGFLKGTNDKKLIKYFFIVPILFFCILWLILNANKIPFIDEITIGVFLIIFGISFVIFLRMKDIKEDKIIKKSVKEILLQKYKNILELSPNKSEISFGHKSEVGNVRNISKFRFKIPQFECTYVNYYIEKLVQRPHYDKSNGYSNSYVYEKINNVVEYRYKLNIPNINSEVLNNGLIKQKIDELAKIKNLKVIIKNNELIVIKETVLNNYLEYALELDINDIELFYKEIVEKIIKGC